jgi:NADH:ubiquinone reductase (H+-translocating)
MSHILRALRIPLLLSGAAAVLLLVRAAPVRRAATPSRSGASHRVVVIGAGFGGLQAARRLAGVPGVALTVLDQHNHHLFQPLLYQVATAALSADDIASPIRAVLADQGTTEVLMEEVTGIDAGAHQVICHERRIPYDTLVVATGSQPSYFGHDAWQEVAPGLKDLDEALGLRQRILSAFERAAVARDDPTERDRLLTFVLVGGGPTGVEMAGSIAELAHDMLPRDFHAVGEMRARVIIVEAGPRILSHFAPDLSKQAADDLRGMGVEVRTGTEVTDIQSDAVHLGAETILAGTIIWTAGVTATPVAHWLGVKPAHGGRVKVQPDLRVPDHPDIYVIGDAALAFDSAGKPLPGLASVAKQQGLYIARAIRRHLRGRTDTRPFAYRDYGTLATIGRNKAVAEFGPVHLTGFVAWVTWAAAHIFFLISFRNRVLVSAQWLMSYATHRRGGRVIVRQGGEIGTGGE